MSSELNIALMRMALSHRIRTESLCHNNEHSLASVEASDTLCTETVLLNRVWHHVSRTRPCAGKIKSDDRLAYLAVM